MLIKTAMNELETFWAYYMVPDSTRATLIYATVP